MFRYVIIISIVTFLWIPGISPAESDNYRAEYETTIEASIDDVWYAFTTAEGLAGWIAPLVEIDFTVGGKMQTNYNPEGKIGDPSTIENTILSFDPKRMLSLKATKFPEGFPFVEAGRKLWSVFYFEELSPTETKIRIVGLGYTDDEPSQKLREFFEASNADLIVKLEASLQARETE